MKKILIFKIGMIGDVLMTTPFVRQLRKNFPNARIDYLVGSAASQVLVGNKNLNEVITFDENIFFRRKIAKLIGLITKIRKIKYDIIFVMDKHRAFNLTAFLSGIKTRVGFDRMGKEGIFLTHKIWYESIRHEIFYYLDLIEILHIKADYYDWKMDLSLTKEDNAFAEKLWKDKKLAKRKVIGIAPGGGKNPGERTETRNWELANFIELIIQLVKRNFFIILLGGPSDYQKEKEILLNVRSKNIMSLVGKTSIKESAAVIKKCRYFICNDSGPMHIAAAVNKHIISVFGPTNPERKAPLWKESTAIWKDQDIYKDSYELYGKINKKRFMEKIKPEDVLAKIK